VCESGFGFGQLEVAQVRRIEGRWVLVFTCHPQEMTAERRAATGDYCTWSVPGTSATGPWDIGLARPFTAEPDLFAAPLVQRRDGSWCWSGSSTPSRRASSTSTSPTRSGRPGRDGTLQALDGG
jgi:beta-fructofuranosidase